MIEVIVAIALISTITAALGTYFVGSIKVSRRQAQIQVAERLVQVAMEQARGLGGPALLYGRGACGSCASVNPYDTIYLSGTQRWDAAVSGVTPTVPLPTAPQITTVNGIQYARYWVMGKCRVLVSGACGIDNTRPVEMIRLVVGVTWSDAGCTAGFCLRAGTVLLNANANDPVFTP